MYKTWTIRMMGDCPIWMLWLEGRRATRTLSATLMQEIFPHARDIILNQNYAPEKWHLILSLVKSSTLLPRLKSTNWFTFVEPAAISLSRVCKNQRPLSQFRVQTRKCCLLSFILLCSDQRGRRTADGLQAQVMSVLDNVTSFLFRLLESFEFTGKPIRLSDNENKN